MNIENKRIFKMADIFIDLDNAVYSPTVDLTLLDIVMCLACC
ncbi:Putative uncharacterized protein [Moritella viscosa]|nr:Putative uncharacterized protein [Moritella viscosa]